MNFFPKFSNSSSRTKSEENTGTDNNVNLARSDSTISQDFTHNNEYKEKNIFSWILNVFRLKLV